MCVDEIDSVQFCGLSAEEFFELDGIDGDAFEVDFGEMLVFVGSEFDFLGGRG